LIFFHRKDNTIMKRNLTAILLAAGMTVIAAGCGNQSPAASSSVASSAAPSSSAVESSTVSAAASTETETASSTASETNTVQGVVIDAAMHSIVLQTKDGKTIYANEGDGEDTQIDTTGLKDGLVLGNGITLTYTGNIDKDSSVTVVSEADCPTKANDADGLETAGEVIQGVEAKNIDTIISCTTFPVYVGIGDGLTIKNADEFKEKVKEDDLFTDELVDSVSHTDLLDLEESEAGLVLSSGNDGTPNITLSKDKDGKWGITGINLTK
jgi:hypothetical protein